MSVTLLNIGFGNVVRADRVVAVVNPASAPMKRLRAEARVAGKLVDATHGRRTRAIVITDSDHVILSAIQAETVAHRLEGEGGGGGPTAAVIETPAARSVAERVHGAHTDAGALAPVKSGRRRRKHATEPGEQP